MAGRITATLVIVGLLCLAGPAFAFPTLTVSDVQSLNSTISGYVISEADPSDDFFDVAYLSYNNLQVGPNPVFPHSIPAVYVMALSTDDVITALKMAIQYGLKTSFQAAGHQFADVGLLTGGITIDMSNLLNVAVYPENKTAYFQPGWQAGDFGNLTAQYGLAFPVPHVAGIGMSGSTLGGGNGWGSNLFGHAVDNVISFDVINTWEVMADPSADLKVVSVDADNYPDLFWGLRGAGQVLAAVVGFHVQLYDLPTDNLIPSVTAIFPLPLAEKAYEQWLKWKETSPITLERTAIMSPIGPGEYGVVFSVEDFDASGDSANAAALQSWAEIANATGAVAVVNEPTPYEAILVEGTSSQDYPGVVSYISSPYLELDTLTVDVFAELVAEYENVTATGPNSIILMSDTTQPAINGITNEDTAFAGRNYTLIWVWSMSTRTAGGAAVDGDAANIAWVERVKALLQPLTQLYYSNMVMYTEPTDTETAFLPASWDRVKELKAMYDPMDLFRSLDYYRPKTGPVDYSVTDSDSAVQSA